MGVTRMGAVLPLPPRKGSRSGVVAAAVAAALLAARPALADSGTYTNPNSGGAWSDPANWANGVVADGQDAVADFSTLDIAAENTVRLDSARTIGGLSFADTLTAAPAVAANWVLSNDGNVANVLTLSTTTGSPTVNVVNQTATISASLAGTQGFTKSGNGVLLLSAANPNLGGQVVVNAGPTGAGALRLGSGGVLGTVSTVTLNNTTVAGGSGTLLDLQGGISVNGVTLVMNSDATGTTNRRTALRGLGGTLVGWGGPINVNGNNLAQFYAENANTVLNVSGNITPGAGGFTGTLLVRGSNANGFINGTINLPAGNFAKTDGSTWTLNSSGNTWLNTQVSNGTLRIGADNALPTTTNLTVGQNGADTATLNLNGFDQAVSGLTVSTTTGTNTITNSGALKTFTVMNAAAANFVGNATNANSARLTGALNLAKSGAGVLTLGGANTYTGMTTVTAGTLALTGNGRLNGTNQVAIGDGGLLDLQVAAINDVAPLRVTSSDTTAEVNLAGGVNDLIGSLILNNIMFATPEASYGSSASPASGGAGNNALVAAGLNPDDFFSGSGVVTVVPEPASAWVAGLAAGWLLARRRRRT